jgi:hypothetical protein
MLRPAAVRGVFAIVMLSTGLAQSMTTPAQKCAVAKTKAAAKKIVSKLKCDQTALLKGTPVSTDCLTAADMKFSAAIAKAEAAAAGGCVVTGDVADIESISDHCVASIAAQTLVPACTGGASCGSCCDGTCLPLCDPAYHGAAACVNTIPGVTQCVDSDGNCTSGFHCTSNGRTPNMCGDTGQLDTACRAFCP